MEILTAKWLRIQGRVQGVGFRESLRQEAMRHDLTGWVRNCPDGTVEALIHGKAEAVALLIEWAHHGPRFAQVEKVDIQPAEPPFTNHFSIRFDA